MLRHFTVLAVVVALASGCTTFDDLLADGDGTACGNACPGNGARAAGTNAACRSGADCASAVCTPEGTCAAATVTDSFKNGSETDVDCGGGEAPKCAEGKTCKEGSDCFWGYCTGGVCEGHQPGRKDGDQTDVDCGGTVSPPCDWDKGCLEDRDCTTNACGPDKKCLVGPSCKTVHGGNTCGTGEFNEGGKQHESCCRTLPVTGFPGTPAGKTVYLDKYEITAGRMRTFLETVAAANGGDVKAFMAARRPTRWLAAWEAILPSGNASGTASFTITNPTVDLAYPGPDKYAVNSTSGGAWSLNTGNYTVQTGLFFVLGASHLFPEYSANSQPTDYPATHNLNCSNETGSYGYGTYWFDAATVAQYSGGVGKKFTKDEMDEKALNCTPFALFVAFCAWDGGHLMTSQLFDYVAGGPWPVSDVGVPLTGVSPPPRVRKGSMNCGGDNTLNSFGDGSGSCPAVYYFPGDQGVTYDGSARIAPPGRVAADTVRLSPGDEPWMDLIGNLQEATLHSNDTFGTRGYGAAWASSVHHRNQETTPRMKAAGLGARCMRVK
jgi:hypothetical protein